MLKSVNLAFGDEMNVMGIVRDISDRKRMESQMIQSERLSALGEMSAGLAHEINQPLTTLSLIFDNILLESDVNHEVDLNYLHAKTEKIFENIERIRNIIDHVRAFSRSHNGYVNAAFDINESIKSALSMISMQYRINGIDLVTQFEKAIPSIVGNNYKFQQVLLNLVGNAKDALLEKKNKLQKNFPMSIIIRTFNDKQYIKVEVEDNGIGIKPEIIDKVLLPFFTTKELGNGTGLGLSISFGLIKEIKGSIDIRSEVLKGTTIIISLPVPEKT
jgi:C4-dicarboxylate-specific signal transduction histidine kinase